MKRASLATCLVPSCPLWGPSPRSNLHQRAAQRCPRSPETLGQVSNETQAAHGTSGERQPRAGARASPGGQPPCVTALAPRRLWDTCPHTLPSASVLRPCFAGWVDRGRPSPPLLSLLGHPAEKCFARSLWVCWGESLGTRPPARITSLSPHSCDGARSTRQQSPSGFHLRISR